MSSPLENLDLDEPQQILVLQTVNHIAHLLNKIEVVEEAIESLMNEFMQLVNADEGSIQLLRPTSEITRRTLIRSNDQEQVHLDSRLDDLLTGWAVMHKQVLKSDNITKTLELSKKFKHYSPICSVLSIPLLVQDRAIGVVNLVRLKSSAKFSNDDQCMVETLANEVACFIEQAQFREQLFNDYNRLQKEIADRFGVQGIIGKSPAMKEVFNLLERIFPTDGRILIQGESGTGKELIAKIIHYAGPRKSFPFVAIDCGALPPNLLESELFGYVRGAFTGANRDRKGLFEEAHRGTLFLDEIANTSIELQSKLLRVLQEGEVRPLGSNKSRKVDVRIVAASSEPIKKKIVCGEFRKDLYYRLNVVPIKIPALRERTGDVAILANHFLKKFSEKHKKKFSNISPPALNILEQYHWPGNVRELENVLERAVILAGNHESVMNPEHLPYEISLAEDHIDQIEIPLSGDLTAILSNFEREILLNVLRHHDWNKSAAARAMNISERVMRYKIQQLKIHQPRKTKQA